MPSKIPQKCLNNLAQVLRQNGDNVKNITFPPGVTAVTAVMTTDLRLDMHPSSKDPGQATGIIQANSGATNKQVKEFIKGKSGGHRGTHQVIEKIRFPLGPNLNIEALANAVEHRSEYADASGSESATTAPQSGWTRSEEYQQIWLQNGDGSYEWLKLYVPDGDLMHEWQYSAECQRSYRYKEDGKFEWAM